MFITKNYVITLTSWYTVFALIWTGLNDKNVVGYSEHLLLKIHLLKEGLQWLHICCQGQVVEVVSQGPQPMVPVLLVQVTALPIVRTIVAHRATWWSVVLDRDSPILNLSMRVLHSVALAGSEMVKTLL